MPCNSGQSDRVKNLMEYVRARACRWGLIERGSKSTTMHRDLRLCVHVFVHVVHTCARVAYGRNKSGSDGGDALDALCFAEETVLTRTVRRDKAHVGQKVVQNAPYRKMHLEEALRH